MRSIHREDTITHDQGFTLVELAIVMTIIGLLIGGVLKGQEMIQNARVTATIAQVKSFQAAVETYRDRFDQLPGDMSTAQMRLPGCTAANYCYNGNGNSIIGTPGTVSAGMEYLNQTGSSLPAVETTMFFKHLALADLISGVNPSENPSNPVWGKTHPSAPVGGGLHIFFSAHSGDWGKGHILRLQNASNEPPSLSGTGTNVISPILARVIDQKMDDGKPDSGFVAADFGGSGCDPTGDYALTEARNCIMYFSVF